MGRIFPLALIGLCLGWTEVAPLSPGTAAVSLSGDHELFCFLWSFQIFHSIGFKVFLSVCLWVSLTSVAMSPFQLQVYSFTAALFVV